MTPRSHDSRVEKHKETEHRLETVRQVFEEEEWVEARQLTALERPLADWEQSGRVFSVEYEGSRYYARYQFDASLQPLPVIKGILAAFGDADP